MRSRFTAAAWAFLGYTVVVVLWGAFVRASLSGDGCGDHWPLCNGVVVPVEPSSKTVIELTHRITSGLCWIWALVMWLASRKVFAQGDRARAAAGWTLFFMTTEALVGAGLVLFRMVADNPSTARAWWMSAHLINTFLLLACMSWMALASAEPGKGAWVDAPMRWKRAFIGAAVVMLFVGVTGAVAALGDTLFPVDTLAQGIAQDLDPSSHLFLRLRGLHPFVAIGVSVYLVVLAGSVIGTGGRHRSRSLAIGLLAAVVAQIGVGFVNLALLAPVWLQLVHLFMADVTWIALVLLALSSPPAISDANLEA